MPDCAVTTDLIAGFSGETEQEHAATLSLMREVGYEFAYMFKYSERPGTFGADIATVPYAVIEQMTKHPLTDQGIEKFQKDYKAVFGE